MVGATSGLGQGAERLASNGANALCGIGDGAANFFASSSTSGLSGGATNANSHLFRFYANGATNSAFAIDGAVAATGAGSAAALSRLTAGAASAAGPVFSNYLEGHVAFVGVVAGDVSAAGGWVAFKAWVASEYALTIA